MKKLIQKKTDEEIAETFDAFPSELLAVAELGFAACVEELNECMEKDEYHFVQHWHRINALGKN